jgi:hypothetical protein
LTIYNYFYLYTNRKCDMNFVIYFKILNKCFILCIYLVVLLKMSAASEAVVVVIVR